MPRGKRNSQPTDQPTDSNRRPSSWYAERLENAEDIALGRQTRYNAMRAEFDDIISAFPDRAKLRAVLDRMLPAYGRLIEATNDVVSAREQYDKRLAEDKPAADVTTEPTDTAKTVVEPTEPLSNGKVAVAVSA